MNQAEQRIQALSLRWWKKELGIRGMEAATSSMMPQKRRWLRLRLPISGFAWLLTLHRKEQPTTLRRHIPYHSQHTTAGMIRTTHMSIGRRHERFYHGTDSIKGCGYSIAGQVGGTIMAALFFYTLKVKGASSLSHAPIERWSSEA